MEYDMRLGQVDRLLVNVAPKMVSLVKILIFGKINKNKGPEPNGFQPLDNSLLGLLLEVVQMDLEIALRMCAGRAYLRSGLADDDMAAVAALPNLD